MSETTIHETPSQNKAEMMELNSLPELASCSSGKSSNDLGTISGFPEFTLAEQLLFDQLRERIQTIYRQYGYAPLETRLVERLSVFERKAGAGFNGKEIYSLGRATSESQANMGEMLGLRFDLTVPLARFVAANKSNLVFPLRRSQIQRVYRGEHAIDSKGRFREFYQFDVDVIGRNTLSLDHDAEVLAIIYQIFHQVLGVHDFVIRINNRKILRLLMNSLGVSEENMKAAVKAIDDLEKNPTKATQTLQTLGLQEYQADGLFNLFRICADMDPRVASKTLLQMLPSNEGTQELAKVVELVEAMGIPPEFYRVDLSIARGLDYYTGTVYETVIRSCPHLGSCCSGGRYNDLVGSLSGNANDCFPGVGISIGMTRLFPELLRSKKLQALRTSPADVMVADFASTANERRIHLYDIATQLREHGLCAIVYTGNKYRPKDQLSYASRLGIPFVVFRGNDEASLDCWTVKTLETGDQTILSTPKEIAEFVTISTKQSNSTLPETFTNTTKTQPMVTDSSSLQGVLDSILASSKPEGCPNETTPSSSNVARDITLTSVSIELQVDILDAINKASGHPVIFVYCGSRGMRQGSVDFYRPFIQQHLSSSPASRVYLLDISAWAPFQHGNGLLTTESRVLQESVEAADPELCGDARVKVLTTADFFSRFVPRHYQQIAKLLKNPPLQLETLMQSFSPSGVMLDKLLTQVMPPQNTNEFKDMDAGTYYSAFQYVELAYVLQHVVSSNRRPDGNVNVHLLMANNENDYYPLETLIHDMNALLSKSCTSDTSATLHVSTFSYGTSVRSRPYNEGQVIRKPFKIV